MRNTILSLFAAATVWMATAGCYYNRSSELYPVAGTCDTSAVTYSGAVQQIMTQQCAYAGCHQGATPSSGIDLSNYAGVRGQAVSGALLGSIEHKPGFSKMPKNAGAKIPDCQIATIRTWVAAGAPNN